MITVGVILLLTFIGGTFATPALLQVFVTNFPNNQQVTVTNFPRNQNVTVTSTTATSPPPFQLIVLALNQTVNATRSGFGQGCCSATPTYTPGVSAVITFPKALTSYKEIVFVYLSVTQLTADQPLTYTTTLAFPLEGSLNLNSLHLENSFNVSPQSPAFIVIQGPASIAPDLAISFGWGCNYGNCPSNVSVTYTLWTYGR